MWNPIGLMNLGNTCYMNSVLQALLANDQFSALLPLRETGEVTHALALLADELNAARTSSTGAVYPDQFREAMIGALPQFDGFDQQDAFDFFGALIERIHSENRHIPPEPAAECSATFQSRNFSNEEWIQHAEEARSVLEHEDGVSFVSSLFRARQGRATSCDHCQTISVKFEFYTGISIPLLSEENEQLRTVDDALAEYQRTNFFPADDMLDCESCGCRRTGASMNMIHSLPSILVIQLKRFGYAAGAPFKLRHKVKFEHQMTIPDAAGNQVRYQLSSVIYHHGSIANGHYTASILFEDQWYHTNDNRVTKLDAAEDVEDMDAYILFYRRVGVADRRKRLHLKTTRLIIK